MADDPTYSDASRSLQDRFDTRRLADRIDSLLVADHLDDSARRFVESVDCVFVATADAEGRPSCSYKGGAPGFVRVLDDRTLALPDYDGNGMFRSWGNVRENPHVGLLFVDFERPNRLRVEGRATVADDDPLLPTWAGAQLVVRITTDRVFPNCPRYIHKRTLVEHSPSVPDAGAPPPAAEWKRMDWARDVLPAGDPALDT